MERRKLSLFNAWTQVSELEINSILKFHKKIRKKYITELQNVLCSSTSNTLSNNEIQYAVLLKVIGACKMSLNSQCFLFFLRNVMFSVREDKDLKV